MSVFLDIPKSEWTFESKFFFSIKDKYPVSPGHTLVISKQVKTDYFQLSAEERLELTEFILEVKEQLEKEHTPDGYNIGMNCGEVAGQTVFHFHCHIIPRYIGDMDDPRGGVRYCIPTKGYYQK